MTSDNNTPRFWLQVKETYILDNFDALTAYLHDYNADSSRPLTDDLVSTLDCLEAMLMRLTDEISRLSTNDIFSVELLPGRQADFPTLFSLFGCGILSARKFGRNIGPLMSGFINLIFLSGKPLQPGIVKRLWDIAVAAIQQVKFVNIGFSWGDITGRNNENISPVIAKFAQHASFAPLNPDSISYCENNALALISGEKVVLAGVNLNTYEKTRMTTLANLPGMLRVETEYDSRVRLRSFDEFFAATKSLFNALPAFKPSTVGKLREYADGDLLHVRITAIEGNRISATSIDPAYATIDSSVFYGYNERLPGESLLTKVLKAGDILKVKYHPNVYHRFNLIETMWDFYISECVSLANQKVEAVNIGEYSKGSIWLTSHGITVSVDNNWLETQPRFVQDAVEDAIVQHTPMSLTIYAKVPTPPYVYANVNARDYQPTDFTVESARTEFLLDFLDFSSEDAPYTHTGNLRNAKPISPLQLAPLANTLSYITTHTDMAASEKLEYVTASNILALMCGHKLDASLMTFNRRYLDRIAGFSCNRPVHPLELPDDLAGITEAVEMTETVTALACYNPVMISRESDSTQSTPEKVARLVEASSNLAGVISLNEQNNIKLALARLLGVEDEYEPIISEKQNYGQESSVLEFKQSIVFPPVNRRRFSGVPADPEIQKWAILKAIDGFLNSKFGGELLLGVNDKGFATGVEGDFDELYKAARIKAPDLDNYNRYVTDLLRSAYTEQGTTRTAADIYLKNIKVEVETAQNGKHIIRVTVTPNPKAIIAFADTNRPAGIESAYTRRNSETLPL